MSAAPRFHCPVTLVTGSTITLGANAARHVQVLRLQPGDSITLFNGMRVSEDPTAEHIGPGEFSATITAIGRRDVQASVGRFHAVDREADREVHLVVGVPANERMDWLVEKATELGAAAIQPLMTARTVLRLDGERAHKKVAHWQNVAIAACEQCGRNRVPAILALASFDEWSREVQGAETLEESRFMLSLQSTSRPLRECLQPNGPSPKRHVLLSGPEGGLTDAEERAALHAGFRPVSLGPRVLRAETAALAALTLLA